MTDERERISTVEARERLSEIVNRAAFGKERVILSRRGKALVAVVPLEDLAILEDLEQKADLDAYRKAKVDFERSGRKSVPWTQVKKELGEG